MQPLRERVTFDSILDLSLRYADADGDDEYMRTIDALRKAVDKFGRRHTSEKIRQSLAARRERGESLGRPRAAVEESDLELLRIGEARVIEVARRLGVSRWTIQRLVGRVQKPS